MTIFDKMQMQQRILPNTFLKQYGKNVVIYDIEICKNYFGVAFRSTENAKNDKIFRLINRVKESEGAPDVVDGVVINEMNEMFSFLAENNPLLCGYNNYSFDDTLIKFVYGLQTREPENLSSLYIWQLVQNLIFKNRKERTPEENKYLSQLRYKTPLPFGVKSIDLMAMFFYNPQTTKSLKELGIALGLPYLQDLPHLYTKVLTDTEIKELETYCINDLNITAGVFNHFEQKIKLFEQINEKCDGAIDVQGSTEPRAAVRWLMNEYKNETGLDEWQVKNMVDFPLVVPISEVLPKMEFHLPQLQELYAKLKMSVLQLNPEKIEAARGDLRNVHYLTKDLTNIVEIGGIKYKTGVGGLHSVDLPGNNENNTDSLLLELDVASYYPNIIRAREIFPRHLTKQWNTLFCSSIGERIVEKEKIKTAKTEEESKRHKENSDALKLRLNGTFGQLLFNKSPVYCPFAGYAVTLTGQLYLLKLIEMLFLEDITCLSANTDGVLLDVPKNMLGVVREIAARWEKEHDMVLEETFYTSVHKHDVNNYIAVKEGGKVKTKGSFRDYVSLQKKNDALIIQKAVVKFFRDGTPVLDTIRGSRDINEFIYYYKCTSKFAAFPVVSGIVPKIEKRTYTQKTFRWYKSTELKNTEYYRERIAGATTNTKIGDVGKIQKTEGAKIINVLPEVFPGDIDYRQYENKAKEIIARCSMLKIATQHEEKAELFRSLGLFPFPKQGKINPKGYKQRGINHKWSWIRKDGKEGQNHDGFYISGAIHTGILEGENTKTGVFDIDKPEDANVFLDLWNGCGNPGLTVFHGDNTFEDVKTGKAKFKVVFFVDDKNDKHRNSTPKLLKTHGVEYLYGKPAVMWGKYSKDEPNDFYHEPIGLPCDMPEELETWLLENLPEKRKPKPQILVSPDQENKKQIRAIGNPTGNEEEQQKFQEDISRLIKLAVELLPEWNFEEDDSNGEFKIFGRCLFEDEHTTASNNRNFDIALKPGETLPYTGCFHSGCATSINQLRQQVNQLWVELRLDEIKTRLTADISPNKEELEKLPDIKTLNEAFSCKNNLLITAPTGSGKTYRAALYILERCKENEKTLFAAANKLEMRQVQDYLRILAGDKYDNLFVQLLESGEKLEMIDVENKDDNENPAKISRNTLCVITHHTYLLRKGEFSNLYYSVLSWIEDNEIDVIIDEFDTYIEKSTYHFQIGARYMKRKRRGMCDIYVKANTCPKFAGNGSCDNCHYRIWQEIDTNLYSLPVLNTKNKISSEDWNGGKEKLVDLPNWSFNRYSETQEAMPVPTRGKDGEFLTEYRNIETHPRYSETKKYKYFLEDGEKYDVKSIFRDFVEMSYFPTVAKQYPTLEKQKTTQKEILEMDEEKRKQVVFPHLPCEVPLIACKDLSILNFLRKKANRLVFMTATMSESSLEVATEIIKNLNHVDIKNSEQKVSGLLIAGLPENLQICRKQQVFGEEFAKHGDVLIFQSTAARAVNLFQKMPGNFPVCLYRENSLLRQEKFTKNEIKHIITNSRGVLGRGVSLPDVNTSFCDCLVYKPSGAFDLTRFNPEEIQARQDSERLQVVEQNLGRSLRGTNKKIHVVYNALHEDLNYFSLRFKHMVSGDIFCEMFASKEALLVCALNFFETGVFKPEEKLEKIDVNEIKSCLLSFREEGLNWTQARRKVNLDRELKKLPRPHQKDLIKELKGFYKSNGQ